MSTGVIGFYLPLDKMVDGRAPATAHDLRAARIRGELARKAFAVA